MPGALTDATRKRETLRNRIIRAGVTFRANVKGQATHLEYRSAGLAVPLRLQLTDLVEKQFANRPSWYRLTSGIVHSADWMLTDVVVSSPTQPHLELRPDILGIGAAALSSIDGCAAVLRAYAGYYGHDPEPAARSNAQRARVLDVLMNEWFLANTPP